MATNQSFSGLWRNLNPIQIKIILSSLAFSFYFQGLDLYFYITSLINFKPTWLTGLYQISLLVFFLVGVLSIPESKKLLTQVSVVDLLYLGFLAAVFLDVFFIGTKSIYKIPENLGIYFAVYTAALFLARSLTFQHLKLIFYFTNIIAGITSILLFSQFLSGSASYTNNATRLVTGLAANPINTGYIGAYTFLTSLTLLIKSNNFWRKTSYLMFLISGLSVSILSGTRSANIFVFLGLSLIIFTFLNSQVNLLFSNKNSPNTATIAQFCFAVGFFIIGILLVASTNLSNIFNNPWFSPFQVAGKRISQLFLISSNQVTDQSIIGRYDLYERGLNTFSENPVFGGQVYSAGGVHNAFIQSASDLGLLGIITFVLPFFYLGINCLFSTLTHASAAAQSYWKSDVWMVDLMAGFVFFESTCLLSFHGDPYRTYIPLCGIGILIAFNRLFLYKKQLK